MQSEISLSIETIAPGDVPALYDLLRASNLPIDGLSAHLTDTLVAKANGQVVGSAALERYGHSALLRSVAVAEPLRGTGLGRQLVESAFDLARRQRVQRLYLLTETAAEWFPRFGFVLVERSAVDPAVQASIEFTSACPDSAQAMEKDLMNLGES